jgi:hypothetical protein
MNDLLQLKGTFEKRGNFSGFRPRNIPIQRSLPIKHLEKLLNDLTQVAAYWKDKDLIPGILLSIEYNRITAKNNRVKGFLDGEKIESNDSIVGAKFTDDINPRHIITHFINTDILNETIACLSNVINIAKKQFQDTITHDNIEDIHKNGITSTHITKSCFVDYIVDSYYVDNFYVDDRPNIRQETSIVTIYYTNTDTIELMKKLGIDISKGNMIEGEDATISLDKDQLFLLKQRAPYLISMATTDISTLTIDSFEKSTHTTSITIPNPTNEPVIGVIDTMFHTGVYFSKWVEFKNMLDPNIPLTDSDYIHGTSVSSLIVDGPSINPNLDDGCGRFRVRHFGVASGGQFSAFSILRSIQQIVASNRDIKVWNLSLGSASEANRNSISTEAAILDKIQHENDVIFIIAGTNKNPMDNEEKRIGVPADSINSLVVNSVNTRGNPASYTRVGPVLSFFNKPDVSCFGGDTGDKIKVCTPMGEQYTDGTSYAAPWIARKMAYLIHKLGLNRETAKALLIDAASGWTRNRHYLNKIGYGIVPKNINDIVKSNNDEIKFILSGTSEKYTSYNYNIPIPAVDGQHPYVARATLCYFPHCLKNHGVDYTSTEFNVKFGRIKRVKDSNGDDKDVIQSINDDVQDNISSRVDEKTARAHYRKWDNIKHIRESFTGRNGAKKAYPNKMWGISITSKEHISDKHGKDVNFGIVVTVKEIKGINRIEDFIQQSLLKGWLVNRINIEQRIDIYNIAEEEVVFEDSNR